MRKLLKSSRTPASSLQASELHNENTFYQAFVADLRSCKHEVVIESPYITVNRLRKLLPVLLDLRARGVKITINTRHPDEHDDFMADQAAEGIARLQRMGIEVLLTGGHHRKVAILDRKVLWEGSLNILSQYDSCEIMRRVDSAELAAQMIDFLNLDQFLR